MTPICGKYNISENELKNMICESMYKKIDLPLVEVFDSTKFQTLMFDLDFTLNSRSIVKLDCILKFVEIINNCLKEYEVPQEKSTSYILMKHKLENNIELKNNKLHCGIHIWFPDVVLNENHRKMMYQDVLSVCKKEVIFEDIDTSEKYENIIDKCTYQRTSVMVFGCSKIGKTFYKPIYQIDPCGRTLEIDYKEDDFDHYYSLFRFNKDKNMAIELKER